MCDLMDLRAKFKICARTHESAHETSNLCAFAQKLEVKAKKNGSDYQKVITRARLLVSALTCLKINHDRQDKRRLHHALLIQKVVD